ncbi:MAG: FGGY family carbohydrate kinase [Planctomycetota bacterium]|nr:FGGY family carbohydrate kinase [Planctomycetota bacterium]
MTLLLGIDLGTTKTTCIAVNSESGKLVASVVIPTCGNITSEEALKLGRSEWDAAAVLQSGFDCLSEIARHPAVVNQSIASLGVTGQQHGMLLVDRDLKPLSPLINWQDQRGNELIPGRKSTWVEEARDRCGEDSVARLGCRLNSGFLGTTLFWLNEQGLVPPGSRACFIMDLLVSQLTNGELQTDPSVAGSAGILNVASRDWDPGAIESLGLSCDQLPAVQEVDRPAGQLSAARACGLPAGTPVAVPIGDHQASFLGSVADRHSSVLLNVGTGAQVAVFTNNTVFSPPVELRPFPIQGNLLSNVGLTGGWSFQVIESFVRQLGVTLFSADSDHAVYDQLTALARQADADCGGLRCVPTFSGTRSNPLQTGSFDGITPHSLTPANFARAVLNGMAENYRLAWNQILEITGPTATAPTLVGAGNGLRENPELAAAVARQFGSVAMVTAHREEAAFGAALVGGVAAGVLSSLDDAGRLINYAPE